jgi:hypothetical protein
LAGNTYIHAAAAIDRRGPVGDVYVYHFFPIAVGGAPASRSLLAATLPAIEKMGRPILESQIVVDESEIDGEGLLIPSVGFTPKKVTILNAQIKSLELRAASRDRQVQSMDPVSDSAAMYMLRLESRHLRLQAKKLLIERSEFLAGNAGHIRAVAGIL